MDETEYLKAKKEIKKYRMITPFSLIAGSVALTIGFVYFLIDLSGTSLLFTFLYMFSAIFIILGLVAKSKARGKVIGYKLIDLEAYDKERRKAQLPIHPVAAEPLAQLQYCPSCGKKLQPDWKVCGCCGKILKKSD